MLNVLYNNAHFQFLILWFATFFCVNVLMNIVSSEDVKKWTSVLVMEIINRCEEYSIHSCNGCRGRLYSKILHSHYQMSLIDKIKKHLESAKTDLLQNLKGLSEQYIKCDIYTPFEVTSLDLYAQYFISIMTPDAMLYGKYVNESDDAFIKKVITGYVRSGIPSYPKTRGN